VIASELIPLVLTLKNCTIQANVGSETLVVKDCVIEDGVEILPTASLGLWDFDIRDNQFFGGYIKPNGTSLATKAYIIGNDFQFPASESPGSFLYVPIDDTNFNVTGETLAGDPIAYNVRVADNTQS